MQEAAGATDFVSVSHDGDGSDRKPQFRGLSSNA
jgi:hypothetical protein